MTRLVRLALFLRYLHCSYVANIGVRAAEQAASVQLRFRPVQPAGLPLPCQLGPGHAVPFPLVRAEQRHLRDLQQRPAHRFLSRVLLDGGNHCGYFLPGE